MLQHGQLVCFCAPALQRTCESCDGKGVTLYRDGVEIKEAEGAQGRGPKPSWSLTNRCVLHVLGTSGVRCCAALLSALQQTKKQTHEHAYKHSTATTACRLARLLC